MDKSLETLMDFLDYSTIFSGNIANINTELRYLSLLISFSIGDPLIRG